MEPEIMKMVLEIGPPLEAWRALSNVADETEDDAYDRAKREFETLEIGVNESVSEYFKRVNIVLTKLERHKITTPARGIKRIVLNSLTPRFPNETCMYAMKGDFELKDLENGLARVEKFWSEQKKSAPSHALAVAHAGGDQTGTGGGARGRGRQGRHLGGCHDDDRGRNQQVHPRQMHPGQQHQPPAAMSQQSHAWQQQHHHHHHHQPRFPQLQQQGPHH